jgi:anti-anti-sigma factor
MDDGRFPVVVTGGVPVVAAPEELDITNAPRLESAMLDAAARGHGTLVVNMSRTRFCDSSGLHVLVAARKRAQADGGELLLVIRGEAVLRLFEITGAGRLIRHFASLEEALAQPSFDGTSDGHGPAGLRDTSRLGGDSR